MPTRKTRTGPTAESVIEAYKDYHPKMRVKAEEFDDGRLHIQVWNPFTSFARDMTLMPGEHSDAKADSNIADFMKESREYLCE